MREPEGLAFRDKGLLSFREDVDVIFMTHQTLGLFLKGLLDVLGESGFKTVTYMQGRISASGVSEFIKKHFGGIDGVNRLYKEIGWGDLRMVEDKGDTIIFEWINNPVGLALKASGIKSDEPMCYFSAGYIHGLVEELVEGRKVKRVVEESCIVKGDDKCTFRVELLRSED